ncbi:MAG: tRNA (adenosine(37)-N6)-threonylcarbamoyltransferase complex ATPase subunit type 1 TsaE [Coprothermobacterota bacterium]|nr:tRNA (adenosine(37)-N6)-threonylcarbamoyltransferase complex ATPase subunit type 1 TsaE [Coprothermobacterota bacterium]
MSPLRMLHSDSPEETRAAGFELAADLSPGSMVALFGRLGAGKTVFVQGLASGLGIPEGWAKSPTFTLVRFYPSDPPFFHIDLYRIERPAAEELGWEEWEEGIAAIEWAEKMECLLPPGTVRVTIEVLGEKEREIMIESDDGA